MCAIVGILGDRAAGPELRPFALSLLRPQRHRGPEGEHVTQLDACVFAHAKLSFQEIGSNSQPVISISGRTILVFNGEIFNLKELKRSYANYLAATSRTDSGILVELFELKGFELLNELEGMFAIAVYSSRSNTLLLARDRLGKKPLYFARTAFGHVFSSELTGIEVALEGRQRLSLDGVRSFLQFGYIPSPHSLLSGVLKVQPGEFVLLQRDGIHRAFFWSPRLPEFRVRESPHRRLEALVRDSVKRRVSDSVGYGVLLSGGVDSAVVAKLAVEALGPNAVPCFFVSVGSGKASAQYAADVCQELGTKLCAVNLEGKILQDLTVDTLSRLDEPNADWSVVPLSGLTRAASPVAKALLSGDGVDEFWFGYDAFIWQKLFGTQVLRRLLHWTATRFGGAASAFDARLGLRLDRVAKAASQPAPETRFLTAAGPFQEQMLVEIQKSNASGVSRDFEKCLFECTKKANARVDLERLQIAMIRSLLIEGILQKVDRAGMLNSTEIRSPFLDERIVSYSFNIPLKDKISLFRLKPIIRRMASNILPTAIALGRKRPFSFSMNDTLRQDLRPLVGDFLLCHRPKLQEYLNERLVHACVNDHLSGRVNHGKEIWALLCLEIWLRGRKPNPLKVGAIEDTSRV